MPLAVMPLSRARRLPSAPRRHSSQLGASGTLLPASRTNQGPRFQPSLLRIHVDLRCVTVSPRGLTNVAGCGAGILRCLPRGCHHEPKILKGVSSVSHDAVLKYVLGHSSRHWLSGIGKEVLPSQVEILSVQVLEFAHPTPCGRNSNCDWGRLLDNPALSTCLAHA